MTARLCDGRRNIVIRRLPRENHCHVEVPYTVPSAKAKLLKHRPNGCRQENIQPNARKCHSFLMFWRLGGHKSLNFAMPNFWYYYRFPDQGQVARGAITILPISLVGRSSFVILRDALLLYLILVRCKASRSWARALVQRSGDTTYTNNEKEASRSKA